MVKRKVSLGEPETPSRRAAGPAGITASDEVLELFFGTGIVYHEVLLPSPLPDLIAGFVLVRDQGTGTHRVRAAAAGDDPDVEIAPLEHLAELSHRWLPFPYQLSAPHCVQVYLAPVPGDPRAARALLAIDTHQEPGAGGRHLDAALDADRPFRPLLVGELGAFLDHPDTRDLLSRMERQGIERVLFKLAALVQLLGPLFPRIRLSRIDDHAAIDVSLILDFGNSRSSAVLAENRDGQVLALPLEIRDSANPFSLSDDSFGSRITLLPSPFDGELNPVAVGAGFALPSVARLGREALDRALETPHRYLCSLSGPKRYLWDDRPSDERWHFAVKLGNEHVPVHGRLFKYIAEDGGGLVLRPDGPSMPADPRYAPRTMMLFALVEVLTQAFAQIHSIAYRKFQGKEGNPRVLRHVVLTHPSGMRHEERQIYEALVRNAVELTCHVLRIEHRHRPNFNVEAGGYEPFLRFDEALASQMVYLYQEAAQVFAGNMEEFVGVYGRDGKNVRIASIDIGGGTTDVMIAEYENRLPGSGAALVVRKLFQDGVSVAGDDVCRAIVEDILFDQLLSQVPTVEGRSRLRQLFAEESSDHGAAWRTLRAKLVPYFWLPLSRCYWALGEGFAIPGHHAGKLYTASEIFRTFGVTEGSSQVLAEADRMIASLVPRFPGLSNLFFGFDADALERAIDRVLREPLRRYADIIAQFDVDMLVLAGRTSALKRVRELMVEELPVAPPRIKTMASYRVGDWYPSRWRRAGLIKDPKSTVCAGATVLHLASRNRIPGFLIETIQELEQRPIYGLYQQAEPHIARANELFRTDRTSRPVPYTGGMLLGFRNVDSPEMDGSPLFEVRPATPEVEAALLEDRVGLRFRLIDDDHLALVEIQSQRGAFSFEPTDFVLALRTASFDRYWLDTGCFKPSAQHLEDEETPSDEEAP